MKKIFFVIPLFVLSFGILKAQTFSLGGGFGAHILMFDKGIENGLTINLLGNLSFNRIIELEFRPGISIASEFIGGEFGGYSKIFPLEEPIYLIIGLKLHWNQGDSRTGNGTRNDLYKLPTLGLGLKHKVLTIEILFQKPYPKGLTWSYIANQYYYSKDFNRIISLNFGFSWQL
jgi:hypothetical protein